MKTIKTNAMRLLDRARLTYQVHSYAHHGNEAVDGVSVASLLHQNVHTVFKTLVVQSNAKEYIVFLLPVHRELDLKKCAKAAGVKNVEMIPVKEINKVTGYVRGGCSPLAMKKKYRTFMDASAWEQKRICFSGGKIGIQIEMDPKDLAALISCIPAEICKE